MLLLLLLIKSQCKVDNNVIYFPQIHVLETPFLNIDCGHLKTFDAELYRQLVCYPQEVIPTFDMSVNEVFFEKYPDAQLQHQIQVSKIIIKLMKIM